VVIGALLALAGGATGWAQSPTLDPSNVSFKIRFGLKDQESTVWDGSVSVAPGEVVSASGWRFEQTDAVAGSSWNASTRRLAPQGSAQRAKGRPAMPMGDNGVLVTLAKTTADSTVQVETRQGSFSFKVGQVTYAGKGRFLEGAVEVERVASTVRLTETDTEDDYPSAVTGPDGTVYVAYLAFTHGYKNREPIDEAPKDFSFLTKETGGDRVFLMTMKNGKWSEATPITDGGDDLYKPAVAVDGTGRAWVFWSENVGANENLNNGDWELLARSWKDGKLGPKVRLTNERYADTFPAAATDSEGRVWVAWQAFRGNNSRILAARQEGDGFGSATVVADSPRNEWEPAVVCAKDGTVTVAWDTYQKGDYDVYLRSWKAGKWAEATPVAASLLFEARPSMVYDGAGRLWVAWEQSAENWAKDFGPLDPAAIPLYRERTINLKVFSGAQVYRPAGDLQEVFTWKPPQGKAPGGGGPKLAMPRLFADSNGTVWLAGRLNNPNWRTGVGSSWFEYVTYATAEGWAPRIFVPDTDNLLDNRPSLVPVGSEMVLIGSCDNRQKATGGAGRGKAKGKAPAAQVVVSNDLYAASFGLSSPKGFAPKLEPVPAEVATTPTPTTEPDDVARMRAYRAEIAGQTVEIARGEFHRHTEISPDGAGDGALLDMWRYGLDVAAMDWLGNGDHDNGNGREYSWWIIQKTTDLLQVGASFTPMFTYERSVNYPDGHRNVLFAYRGVRPLNRLTGGSGQAMDDQPASAKRPNSPDTLMLYKYLEFFKGLCSSHTSGTDMGTDWRDNDPEVEPAVEIYQGDRQNYEMPGAPRANTAEYSIGGWRPLGFVSNALQKGYRLAFQASSDHVSTHLSYCNVWVPERTREAVIEGIRRRHVYASTDNIVADLRCTADGKEYFMGDEFETSQAPELKVKLVGSQPFARVVIVKDNEYVYSGEPKKREVELTWRDASPTIGKTSYYYVRGEQEDGELVWISPMWIRYRGA
jgi:hypothetical protein